MAYSKILYNNGATTVTTGLYCRGIAASATGTYQLVGYGNTIGKLYLSTNSGSSFSEITPAGAGTFAWTPVAMSADGSVMIAGIYGGRLYLSTNSGSSWSETRPAGDANGTWYFASVSENGAVILAGDGERRLWLSTNSGSSWSEIRPNGDADFYWVGGKNALSADGQTIFVGATDSRLWLSTNQGTSFSEVRPAGDVDKSWTATGCSSDGSILYAGIYDASGALYRSIDGGSSWASISTNGRYLDLSCTKDGQCFSCGCADNTLQPIYSLDGGNTVKSFSSVNISGSTTCRATVFLENKSKAITGRYSASAYAPIEHKPAYLSDEKLPGTAATATRSGSSGNWANQNNITAENGSYASVSISKNSYTNWLRGTNYGFSTSDVASGSTVIGFYLRRRRYASGAGVDESALYLRDSTGQVGSNFASSTEWPTSVADNTIEAFSTAVTDSQVRASTFGLDLSAECGTARTGYIDTIGIKVLFTIPDPNTFDRVTIAESVTVETTEPPTAENVSVNDTAAVSESVTAAVELLPQEVNVHDTATLAESATATVSDPAASVYDSASTAEDVAGYIGLETTATDTLSVTEQAAARVSDPAASVVDSISIAEHVVVSGPTIAASVYDETTLAEAVAADAACNVNVTATLEVSEQVTADISVTASVVDTATTEEAATVDVVSGVNVYDAAELTEEASASVSDLVADVLDSATISEVASVLVAAAGAISIIAADEPTLTEHVSAVASLPGVDVYDSAAVEDSPTVEVQEAATVQPTAHEAVGVSESVAGYIGLDAATHDAATLTEEATARLSVAAEVSDSATVEDAATASVGIEAAADDQVAAAEYVQGYIGIDAAASDTATVEEAASVSFGLAVDVFDASALADYVDPTVGDLPLEVSDAVSIAEAVTAENATLPLTAIDEVTIAEDAAAYLIKGLSVEDGVAVGEHVSAELFIAPSVYDSTTAEDVPAGQGGDLEAATHDAAEAAEHVSVDATGALSEIAVNDSLTISESVTAVTSGLSITVHDAAAIAENNETTRSLLPGVYRWLFSIGTAHYSTERFSYAGSQYEKRVIPTSFSGVSVRWNIGSAGLIAPSEVTFDLDNADGDLSAASLVGQTCRIAYELISDAGNENLRTWDFVVRDAIPVYGRVKVYCEDFLQSILQGDWPNTEHPKEVWPSADQDPTDLDDYTVPVAIGEAYIPVMSVYTGADRYYVLGYGTSPTFTVDLVRSPREWPYTSTWTETDKVPEVQSLYLGDGTGGTFDIGIDGLAEEFELYLGGATGGTFTIGKTGTMRTCAYNISASSLLTEINTALGAGKCSSVTLSPPNFDIVMAYATGASGLIASFSGLTGATDPALTKTVTYTAEDLETLNFDASASEIETALESVYGAGNVSVSANSSSSRTSILVSSLGSGSFTVPYGVYSVTGECWGGGGGGAAGYNGVSTSRGGGGGGGGAFARKTFDVTPGESISFSVGAGGTGGPANEVDGSAGSVSWFSANSSSGCVAAGGGGGAGLSGGAGGTTGSSYGDVEYAGGAGAGASSTNNRNGGGGGGGAGSLGAGSNASTTSGGAGGTLYGGTGGTGSSTTPKNSTVGGNYGGGGGGGYGIAYNSTVGEDGGPGLVRISYGSSAGFTITFHESIGDSNLYADFTNLVEAVSPYLVVTTPYQDDKTYTFNTSNDSGHKVAQFIINDSDGDGDEDANGLWLSGESFMLPFARFTRSDTETLTNPADFIEYILKDFGIDSDQIDSTSFSAAETEFDRIGLEFSGGFWRKERREGILGRLLSQCDGFIYQSDKVELYQFCAQPVETFDRTKTKRLTFRAAPRTKKESDGGRVAWREPEQPQDVLTGKAVVPLYGAQASVTHPGREVLNCDLVTDSKDAQRAGILYFQKRYATEGTFSFSTTVLALEKVKTLRPGQVVTIDDELFGETAFDVIVTGIDFLQDGEIRITTTKLSTLEDWGDLNPSAVAVTEPTYTGWRMVTEDGGSLQLYNLPTSSSGLPTGSLWNDNGTVKIV